MTDGRYHDPLAAYQSGSEYYLRAQEAGALYGAQVYWYPVSGRVQLSLRGRQLQFLVNSDAAKLGGRTLRLKTPALARQAHAYVPMSFLLSEDFAAWAGADTSFDARTRLLSVDKRSTVGSVHWFSYGDHTRLILELKGRLSYSAAKRGLKGVELVIPAGTVAASEEASIEDGLVSGYSLRQGREVVKLSVKLARAGLHWRVAEFSDPRRLALDLYLGQAPSEAPSRREEKVSAGAAAGATSAAAPAFRRRRIVIDAGHGGKDPGASGRRGTREKDINLLAAKDLAKLLKDEGAFEVLMTRTEDTFVPLAERSRLANEFGADLFISLHCNASSGKQDDGFEVYFLSEKASDPQAQRLANMENSVLTLEGKSPREEQAAAILKEMTKTENINAGSEAAALLARALAKRLNLENRGVKQAAFYVLRGTYAPAVLLEMAYLTNKKDEAKLRSRRFRRKLIDGIYAGILEYGKRRGWTGGAD